MGCLSPLYQQEVCVLPCTHAIVHNPFNHVFAPCRWWAQVYQVRAGVLRFLGRHCHREPGSSVHVRWARTAGCLSVPLMEGLHVEAYTFHIFHPVSDRSLRTKGSLLHLRLRWSWASQARRISMVGQLYIRIPYTVCDFRNGDCPAKITAYIGLAKIVYTHRIWPSLWWFLCLEHRIYRNMYVSGQPYVCSTPYIRTHVWFWPTLKTSHAFLLCILDCKAPSSQSGWRLSLSFHAFHISLALNLRR